MKKRNFLHFAECLVLIPLFVFLALFMRLETDLFFYFTAGFTALAGAMLIVYFYIAGDSEKPHPCGLLPIDLSDLFFFHLLIQLGMSTVFLILRNLSGEFSPWTALACYLGLLAVTVLVALLHLPEDAPPPAPTNERDEVSEKQLRYYTHYLEKLCKKCEYQPLVDVMHQLSDLLSRLDPAYSVQLQALEDDISAKCVKIENAQLTGDHSRFPLLTRELEATVAHIHKRIDDYRFTLTDEGFYHEDDEIAMEQIDRLLDKLGLDYEEDLPNAKEPFWDEFFCQKALQFASPQYRTLLEGYNAQIVRRLHDEEQARQARLNHRLRYFRRGSDILALGLMTACVALPLLWHVQIRPQGFTVVEDAVGRLEIVDYNPFYGDEVVIPAKIGKKPVIAVGEDALKGMGLISLTLEEGVQRLDYQSIRDNEELISLQLPKSLNYIGNYATYKLSALTEIHYAGTQEEWLAIKIENLGNDPLTKAKIICAEEAE